MAMPPRQAVMATAPRQAPMAMALHQALMGMARRKEPIPHQEPMARRQAPMVRGQAPMARRKGPMPRRPSMSRRPPQAAGAQLITNGPQTNPGDVSPSWSAQRNVVESEEYERLLKGNPAFRQARMRKECGPITDPQLHRQCLDSFRY